MIVATANHASTAIVVAFAIGLPVLVVALTAFAAVASSRSENR
jgi:hypothetical protein